MWATSGEAKVLRFTLHKKNSLFPSIFLPSLSPNNIFFVIFDIVVTFSLPYVYFEFILNRHNNQL
jgi:hypothetical protein